MKYMGTLYIDKKDMEVRLDSGAIAFYSNGVRDGIAPIKPLKRVVISSNVLIETTLLGKLAEENITVVFLSGKQGRFRGILNGRLHNNGILRLKQYEKAISSFCQKWSKKIVIKKLSEQRDLLKEAVDMRTDLRYELTKATTSLEEIIISINTEEDINCDRLRGFEGGAGTVYFSAYTSLFPESLNFKRRERRPPPDPVNALLSLVYTLIHYEAVREIETIGFDPTIGFYHSFEYGRASLACDIIEPLRPEVDKWVWRLFAERTFRERDFAIGDERPGCYLKKKSRKRFYPLYEEWAADIRASLNEDVRCLAKEITDGEFKEDSLSE